MELLRALQDEVDLIAAREGASIEENDAFRVFAENPCGRLEHDLQNEVVLRRRVLDVRRSEERMADFVFAEDGAVEAIGERGGQRRFAGAWQASEEDDHCGFTSGMKMLATDDSGRQFKKC